MGELDRNPFKLVKPPRFKPVRESDPFTPAEVQTILATAKEKFPWFYPCILTAALTGARRNVLIQLKVQDIDHVNRKLVVPPEIAKHDKRHNYALPDCLYEVLVETSRGREADSPLFRNKFGRIIAQNAFDLYVDKNGSMHAWRRLLKAARVKPRGIHNMRSAVDTNLVAAGVSLDLAVTVTGHTREVAQKHYLRINDTTQRQTISQLAKIYGSAILENNALKLQFSLSPEQAEVLTKWILEQQENGVLEGNSGANSGANFPDARKPIRDKDAGKVVEVRGFEPLAFALRTRRSTN